VRLEELGQLKNLMASSGFEPVTFRFVAYQLDYRVPREKEKKAVTEDDVSEGVLIIFQFNYGQTIHETVRNVFFIIIIISCKFTIYSTNGVISKYDVRKVTCAE
jgi:hypothetical protein